jgi:beta-lactamase superfamily II metal-dependent hydrolase
MLLGLLLAVGLAHAAKTLDIYFVDVEGGAATLYVTPNKEAILVDTGYAGFNGRDADRIKAAAKAAGVKKIDFLIATHYHADHVGGIRQLLERIPVTTFVDHGPSVETTKAAQELKAEWDKAVAGGKHLVVKPGDKLPLKKDVEITFLSSNGEVLSSNINGGGAANPACGSKSYPVDPGENARSVGFFLTYGKFRTINMGDLSSAKEASLVCPNNRVGKVDLYVVSHHGTNTSNPPEIVQAVAPRVAVMANGARKGGAIETFKTVKAATTLEDLWQLHFAVANGKDGNVPDSFIANLNEGCEGQSIKVSAMNDGSFTVVNNRNKYLKTYAVK